MPGGDPNAPNSTPLDCGGRSFSQPGWVGRWVREWAGGVGVGVTQMHLILVHYIAAAGYCVCKEAGGCSSVLVRVRGGVCVCVCEKERERTRQRTCAR